MTENIDPTQRWCACPVSGFGYRHHRHPCTRAGENENTDPTPTAEKDVCEPERVYAGGEAWVGCSCGEAITCSKGREFGHTGHSHSDECLPLVCPGLYRPRVIPPTKTEGVTLYINRSDSRCGGCGLTALPTDKRHVTPCGYDQHPGCGAEFIAVSSDYFGINGLYDDIRAMRPDLPFIEPGTPKEGDH